MAELKIDDEPSFDEKPTPMVKLKHFLLL